MVQVSFEDFYKVPELKFDISKLRNDLDLILENKKFNSPGVTHFGAISLNQIPNDENSIKGNNIRGKYWTIADETVVFDYVYKFMPVRMSYRYFDRENNFKLIKLKK